MSASLAIDIGGSHGRAVLSVSDGRSERMTELDSFSTEPVMLGGKLCWNLDAMLKGIRNALEQAAGLVEKLDSVAVDTMGLAFGLLDKDGSLLCPPVYTRTAQDERIKNNIIAAFGRERLYSINGLEQQKLNSLYYLELIRREAPALLKKTAHFIMLPDLINYMLCGVIGSEYTIASSSALWNIGEQKWSEEIIDFLGMTPDAFAPAVNTPRTLARLSPKFASARALRDTLVLSIPAHDTAAAFYSLSGEDMRNFLISCGTWGMSGCILDRPILTPEALDSGFANEGAAGGKVKLLNNAPGMSLLSACMKQWRTEGYAYTWPDIYAAAQQARSTDACLPLYFPGFRTADNVPECIRSYCADNFMPVPSSHGETVRLLLQSFAKHYAHQRVMLERLSGLRFEKAVMVGGAVRSGLFRSICQDSLGISVSCGSAEASIHGNLKAQREALAR